MSQSITIEVPTIRKAKCPSLPNYIKFDDEGKPLHISSVSEDVLQKIGDEWTRRLIQKAKDFNND